MRRLFSWREMVLQGILQGESIPKIAARMQNVTGSNAKAAVRTAVSRKRVERIRL